MFKWTYKLRVKDYRVVKLYKERHKDEKTQSLEKLCFIGEL